MTKVVHLMKEVYEIDITRNSMWGNPYSHKEGTWAKYVVESKDEAIEKYKEYAKNSKKILESLGKLEGKVLGCWCAPLGGLTHTDKPFRCHGQVLLEMIEDDKKITKENKDGSS